MFQHKSKNQMRKVISKIVKKVKLGLNDLEYSVGKNNYFEKNPTFSRIILYHGVDEVGNTEINSRFISKKEFEKQIIFFKDHFQVLSLTDIFENKFDSNEPVVCVTFDDGYANNFYNAFPVLEKHKVPATFFITTIKASGNHILWADALDLSAYKFKKPIEVRGETFEVKGKKGYVSEETKIPLKESIKLTDHNYKLDLQKAIPELGTILKEESLKPYWELLSTEQIEILSRSELITIGSHGYYHNCLDQLPETEIKFELEASKEWLENIIKNPVTALAFPDGSFSGKLISIARSLGYKQFLSVDGKMNGIDESSELRSRMGINPHISLNNQMRAIIKGKY